MNNLIQAFIFDLDGVVVDTARYHYIAWNMLAHELGSEFSEKDNEKLKGVSRMRSLEILLETIGRDFPYDEKVKLAEKKNAIYIDFISKMTPAEILPGVLNFLTSVRKLQIKTALGSASKNVSLILERTGLKDYFDIVVDGNSVKKAKPDPEVFLSAAKMLNVEPSTCIVFEDAKAGIEAAIHAGMKCIGIGDSEVLGDADFVITGFENLAVSDILLKFN